MISLRQMTEQEFQTYLDRHIPYYASEKVASGNWDAHDALKTSQEEIDKLLPAGLSTKYHYLYIIQLDEVAVGEVWLSMKQDSTEGVGFICDLHVAKEYRYQGIASEAMRLLEDEAVALRIKKLTLHVFGHNLGARALYEKLGYETTNLYMAKLLNTA